MKEILVKTTKKKHYQEYAFIQTLHYKLNATQV